MPLWRGCARCSMHRGWAGRVCVLGGISGCCSSATSRVCRRSGGIAWRVADSLSLRAFLDLDVTEAPPNHSTLSRTRRLIDVETHVAVVRQANWRRMAGESPAEGRSNQPPSPRVMRRSL